MRYWTWLLIQAAPNKVLRDEILDWVGHGRVSLDERLTVSLSARDGIASLRTDDLDRLNDLLLGAREHRIPAFSFAPAHELRHLHNRLFYGRRSRLIQIHWAGADPAPIDPYYRRLVTLEYRGAINPDSLDNAQQTDVEQGSPDPDRLLILNPERLQLDEDVADRLSVNGCKPLKEYNATLLAPVREQADGSSYFACSKRRVRQALDRLWRQQAPESAPAALSLWRFIDDPLVRDILEDGGCVRLLQEHDHRTAFALDFFAREASRATRTDGWRMTQFLRFEALAHPDWARKLGEVLRQDLVELSAGFVRFGSSAQYVDWNTDSVRSKLDTGGPKQGMWQVFEKLMNALGNKRDAEAFRRLVLAQSWSSFTDVFDHDMAELLFNAHLFRCPWASEADQAWRETIADLAQEINTGAMLSPTERARSWNDLIWTEDERYAFGRLEYPASTRAHDVQRLRLLYPLGTRFRERLERVLVLDTESGRLDDGFELAGGRVLEGS